jgi:hypothetical protein
MVLLLLPEWLGKWTDTRELEQDLIWVRSQVLGISDYEKFSEGGDIEALSMGEVSWETEVEMTDVLDLYRVLLRLDYEGNEDYGIEPGTRSRQCIYCVLHGVGIAIFRSDRARLLDDRRRKMQDHQDERRRNSR